MPREAEKAVSGAGFDVRMKSTVRDRRQLKSEVGRFLESDDDVLLVVGGTGLESRDFTLETVRPFFEKELDGFGELLRKVAYDEVGADAMQLRATAGVFSGKLVVCVPARPRSFAKALRLFAKEFPHIVFIARKRPPPR